MPEPAGETPAPRNKTFKLAPMGQRGEGGGRWNRNQEVVGAMQRLPGESKRVACQKRDFLAVESFSVLTRTFNGCPILWLRETEELHTVSDWQADRHFITIERRGIGDGLPINRRHNTGG
jgi:hypothetical protein